MWSILLLFRAPSNTIQETLLGPLWMQLQCVIHHYNFVTPCHYAQLCSQPWACPRDQLVFYGVISRVLHYHLELL